MAEKIFKREDGSRVKITVSLPMFSRATTWNVNVEMCEPGKRKFKNVVNHEDWKFRSLDSKGREGYARELVLNFITKEEINEVKKLALDELSLMEYRFY